MIISIWRSLVYFAHIFQIFFSFLIFIFSLQIFAKNRKYAWIFIGTAFLFEVPEFLIDKLLGLLSVFEPSSAEYLNTVILQKVYALQLGAFQIVPITFILVGLIIDLKESRSIQ